MTAELVGGPHDGTEIEIAHCPQFITVTNHVESGFEQILYEIEQMQYVEVPGEPIKYIFVAPAQIPQDL